MSFRGLARAGAFACACSAGCADAASAGRNLPAAFAEPVPLPGCETFEYRSCDVRAPACVENLARIATCLRTGGAAGPSPAVSFASEDEARLLLLASLEQTPPAVPDYFELVLTQLGLTTPHAFEPGVSAARLANRWAAFYRRDLGDVVVIDHVASEPREARDPLVSEALVLHELIHALQDREHDLDAFAREYQTDSDGTFRGSSVIEGEAQLYEQRFYAALNGVDASTFDWAQLFGSQREAAEERVFAEPDVYSASLLSVPYAHGSEYVAHVWAQAGAAGVRELLAAPPRDMREILAQLWGDATPRPSSARVETPPVRPSDALLQTWSTLGSWGVYLFFRPRLANADSARELALAWRGDRLEAFSFGGEQVAARWWIELADGDSAARLAAAVGEAPRLRARSVGTQLRLISASTDELPPWLDP